MNETTIASNVSGFVLVLGVLVLALLSLAIIWGLFFNNKARATLAGFLTELPDASGKPSKPSISRLQMIIWNFVVAFAFLYVLAAVGVQEGLDLIEVQEGEKKVEKAKILVALDALFRPEILVLLGIGNGTYLISKGVGRSGGAAGAQTSEVAGPSGTANAVRGIPTAGTSADDRANAVRQTVRGIPATGAPATGAPATGGPGPVGGGTEPVG